MKKLIYLTLTVINLLLFLDCVWAMERPNFLFIFADDQAQESLGCYGNQVCQTPNIDRLAREGMLIRDAHHMGSWSGAVCRPSRTMLMTGRSVWRIPGHRPKGTTKEEQAQHDRKLNQSIKLSCLPALFNAAGYDTFRTCKASNTFPPANKLFDEAHDHDMREGNDEEGSAWHGDHVIKFLERRKAEDDTDPFLIFLGFSHPHDPRNGKPELLKKYGARNLVQPPSETNPLAPPLPINYLSQHPFHHGHPGLRDEVNVEGVKKDRSEATIRNELGREYACIENIDRQVARALAKLTELGELDNTYIIYTSDHGIAIGRHGLMGKQNLYEHTWRVPMLVRGPGIKAGSAASGFVYLMDVLPTLCELAQVQIPEEIEGKSFKSILFGEQERIRNELYGVYCGGTKPGIRSVKTADGWKLIKYDVLDGYVRETQLFDLNNNPNEFLAEHHLSENGKHFDIPLKPSQTNLAADPKYSEKLQNLESILQSQQQQYGDPYRLENQ